MVDLEINSTGLIFGISSAPDVANDGTATQTSPSLTFYVRKIMVVVNYCILGTPINLAGCVANIINIVVFIKMGFSDTINISLLGLAIADLFGLLAVLWMGLCFNPLFQNSDLPFDSFEVQYVTGGWPHVTLSKVTGLITAYISFERCLCVASPLKVKTLLTPPRTVVIVVVIFVAMIGSTAPIYTVNGLGLKYYESHNRSLVGLVLADNRHQIEQAMFALSNLYGYFAFAVVIMCTAVLIKKLKTKSRWREKTTVTGVAADAALTSGDSGKSGKESSSLKKDRKVVAMVTALCSIFIACYCPATIFYITLIVVPYFGFTDLFHCILSVVILMETINSSVNIFIYFRMSSKFRSTFYELFKLKEKELT